MLRFRPLPVLGWAALLLATLATPSAAAGLAAPFDLYEIGPMEAASFGEAAAAPGPWAALAQETARKALTLTGDDYALEARARRLIGR